MQYKQLLNKYSTCYKLMFTTPREIMFTHVLKMIPYGVCGAKSKLNRCKIEIHGVESIPLILESNAVDFSLNRS